MTDYHSRPELSSSQLADFIRDPVAFHHWHVARDWDKPEPSPQMAFGTNVHRMIELGGWQQIAVEIPPGVLNADGHKKGKAWQDWAAEHDGLIHIKPGELNPYAIIWDHLQANAFCRGLLAKGGEHEKVILWRHASTGIACRTMVDWWRSPLLVDWKTTRNTGAREFQRDAWSLLYHVRLAFYCMAVESETGRRPSHVVTVAIQNGPGYNVQPFELDAAWLDIGFAAVEAAMQEIASFEVCNYLNHDVLTLSAPRWARYEEEYEVA